MDLFSRALNAVGHFKGKARLVNSLGHFISTHNNRYQTLSLGNGVTLRLDLGDRIQRLMWGGAYEPHVKNCMKALLRPGDTFVDVGAHIGFFSMFALSLIGEGDGRVFAFEANPQLFPKLESNFSGRRGCTAYPKAVWRESGRILFSDPMQAGESGWGKVAAVRNEGNVTAVEAISLDDWHAEIGSVPVRLLKIDAEGSEPAIFEGALELIQRSRPYIVTEINDVLLEESGYSERTTLEGIRGLSYLVFSIRRSQLVDVPINAQSASLEVLCVPSEKVSEVESLFA